MRGRCVAECAKLRMPGHALEGPSVVAPCADGSASDVADRSGVGSSGAGEEQRSRGGKRHKGDGAQFDRYRPSVQRAPSRRRARSAPLLQPTAIGAPDVDHRKVLKVVVDAISERTWGLLYSWLYARVFHSVEEAFSPRPGAPRSSPAATPLHSPCVDQVPADAHAKGLMGLGLQNWFLPVKAIARAAKFESLATATTRLRGCSGRQWTALHPST
jgi:hypothetical protein